MVRREHAIDVPKLCELSGLGKERIAVGMHVSHGFDSTSWDDQAKASKTDLHRICAHACIHPLADSRGP